MTCPKPVSIEDILQRLQALWDHLPPGQSRFFGIDVRHGRFVWRNALDGGGGVFGPAVPPAQIADVSGALLERLAQLRAAAEQAARLPVAARRKPTQTENRPAAGAIRAGRVKLARVKAVRR